jgi:hypothetical protein
MPKSYKSRLLFILTNMKKRILFVLTLFLICSWVNAQTLNYQEFTAPIYSNIFEPVPVQIVTGAPNCVNTNPNYTFYLETDMVINRTSEAEVSGIYSDLVKWNLDWAFLYGWDGNPLLDPIAFETSSSGGANLSIPMEDLTTPFYFMFEYWVYYTNGQQSYFTYFGEFIPYGGSPTL